MSNSQQKTGMKSRTAWWRVQLIKLNNAPFPWGALLALYSAISFVILGMDMALLHFGFQHFHFFAVMPVVFCAVAALVSFATTFSRWLRRQAWVLGGLAMGVGALGTYFHLELVIANLKDLTSLSAILQHLVFDPRPPLAPAAVAGTGLLLVLVSVAERWPLRCISKLDESGHGR